MSTIDKSVAVSDTTIFKCAFSDADNHFFSKPIELTCGHHVCRRCVPGDGGGIRKKCKLCNKTNKIDLRLLSVSNEMKNEMKSNFDELFYETRNNFSFLFVKIKDAIGISDSSVEAQVDYVRNEIEIRIESLKCELDNLNLTLNNQLNTIRDELLSITRITSGVDVDECEISLQRLNKIVEMNNEQSKTEFSNFQKQLQNMNRGLAKLKEMKHQLRFNASEATIDPSFIGKIEYNPSTKKYHFHNEINVLPKYKRDPLNFISNPINTPEFRREVDLYLKHSLLINDYNDDDDYETPRITTSRSTSRQENLKNSPLFDVLIDIDGQKRRLQNESPELLLPSTSINTISSQLIRLNSNEENDRYSWRPSIQNGRRSCLDE